VSYSSLIDDNNPNNYKINWSKFNLDTDALLAKVDYSADKVKEKDEAIARKIAELQSEQEKILKKRMIIFILFGVIILAGILLFIIKISRK
jgi:hypothetical protein